MPKLSFFQRMAARVLETKGKRMWGFKPNLIKNLVAQKGGIQSIRWFSKNMSQFETLLKEWGPIRTHLISAAISALNGCEYCLYGHIYAFQLHYFEFHKGVFVIDENEFCRFADLEFADTFHIWRKVLFKSKLLDEIPLLERCEELMTKKAQAAGPTDEKILFLIETFSFLNACGIDGCTVIDEAHDPINKNIDLKRLYFKQREKSKKFRISPHNTNEPILQTL